MEDEGKTKKQLISEVEGMRQCDAALNATETESRQAVALSLMYAFSLSEADELLAITVSSIKTTRKQLGSRKKE